MPTAPTQPRLAERPPPRPSRPRWPLTAGVVLLGWCLLAWTVFGAGINTAPFFGDIPSRSQYVESGMACLTALLPVALLLLIGRLAGSRWGLLLLAVPAVLLVPLGLEMLSKPGDPTDPSAGRAVGASDVFADLTRPSWASAVVLFVVLGAVLVARRRRARALPSGGARALPSGGGTTP
ncbi:hypothetical protein [Phycicoccus sp. Soil748]|uniref:hypothetical protein n=1 Tax=Intrasporangiaceae TaxID=85021 RepID=UPI00070388FC|nr:hypothetical protein [Phycicoccus sp. Soil748]KRE58599.1 hypothetical protein ASG70_17635 [Phycicoccus sp. Soil748]